MNQPTLLIEEFRAPIVDRFTMSLINSRTLAPDDFYHHYISGGMYLKRDALKTYLEKYERFMQNEFTHPELNDHASFRKAIRHQAHKLAANITEKTEYHPLVFAK